MGLYQHELAQAIGISTASYSRLERGEAPDAPLWWYINCALALNVELEAVVGLEALKTWRPSARAPKPPNAAFLADRHERALAWAEDVPEE